jgi:hypothetical protein
MTTQGIENFVNGYEPIEELKIIKVYKKQNLF